jgi:hypothetical protein
MLPAGFRITPAATELIRVSWNVSGPLGAAMNNAAAFGSGGYESTKN